MGRKIINRIGQRFHRLTIRVLKRVNGVTMAECECDCGATSEVALSGVVSGTTKSCGCFRREYMSQTRMVHGEAKTGRESAEYRAWRGMINRCENGDEAHRRVYRDRGITVCAQWRHSFQAFLVDVGRKPTSGHSLDRYPDNNGDYRPGNVRWATRSEQAKNRRERPRDAEGNYVGGVL